MERSGEVDERQSMAEQVKQAAQNAMQQTGFVYEETSGMYYDYSTGYYYNAVSMICGIRPCSVCSKNGFVGIFRV